MEKGIFALSFFILVLMTGCTVTEGVYTPAYNNDYVYSVGYYGYRPFWSANYNSGYGWGGGNRYWRGYGAGNWGGYRAVGYRTNYYRDYRYHRNWNRSFHRGWHGRR